MPDRERQELQRLLALVGDPGEKSHPLYRHLDSGDAAMVLAILEVADALRDVREAIDRMARGDA